MSRPQLMGILNVTPDSFSGDGRLAVDAALQRFAALVKDGADIVDMGAESTRPGATPLTAQEEWARLEAVLQAIAKHPARKSVGISLDTYHAETAERGLALGVDLINDVSGLSRPEMRALLAGHRCGIVVMHQLGLPADPEVNLSEETDVVTQILAWKQEVLALAKHANIAPQRLIFDPGIGFGKTATQSLALIDRACELVQSGGEWLFGHSRKRFLTAFTDAPAAARDAATLECSIQLAKAGVAVLRVHDVAGHARYFAEGA